MTNEIFTENSNNMMDERNNINFSFNTNPY